MTLTRARFLGGLGIAGSLLWLSLNTFLAADWGPPGTARYLGYEAANRLWAVAFGGMLCGLAGLAGRYPLAQSRPGRAGLRFASAGLLVMIAGNIAEFWLFSRQAYGELNGRNLAWIAVLLGWLAVLSGLGLIGLAASRQRCLPGWSAVLLMLALPVTLLLIVSQAIELLGLPLVTAGILVGGLAGWPAPAPQPQKGTP